MTPATYDSDLVEHPFGWLDVIAYTDDPWRCWLGVLPARHLRGHGPLDAWIEDDADKLIQRADRLRLSIVPETKRATGPDPLSEYAAMVLLITKRSIGEGK